MIIIALPSIFDIDMDFAAILGTEHQSCGGNPEQTGQNFEDNAKDLLDLAGSGERVGAMMCDNGVNGENGSEKKGDHCTIISHWARMMEYKAGRVRWDEPPSAIPP